jgi:hypothetical protein
MISLRQHNIKVNKNINRRLKKCFYFFKNKIYIDEYMNENIFDKYKELNNGTLKINLRLCIYCNKFVIVNMIQDKPISFNDIISTINHNINKYAYHEKSIYCNNPTPVIYDDIEELRYIERYNQLDLILY